MLNSIILLGRLTKTPELRKTNSDVSLANFDLAVDNPFLEADGTRGTTFISCRCFRDTAENVCKHLHKGSKVAVSGSLVQRNFIRQDGTKGSAYEVIADSVEFLDPKPQEIPSVEDKAVENLPDDDLPFKQEETKPQEKSQPAKKEPQPKFDPYTGKPLKPKAKK